MTIEPKTTKDVKPYSLTEKFYDPLLSASICQAWKDAHPPRHYVPNFVDSKELEKRRRAQLFLAWQTVHNSRKLYLQRIQASGNVVTFRTYEKDQAFGYCRTTRKPMPENFVDSAGTTTENAPIRAALTAEQQAENQKKSGRRAKTALINLVNSNFGEFPKGFLPGKRSLKLLTLTYKENMQDRERAAKDLERFIKRLEYHFGEKIEYVNVFEQQQRGAWHLHLMLVSDFLPVRILTTLWNAERGQGTLKVERVRMVRNAGRYLAKYLSEDFDATGNTSHVFGKKRFTTSRGLKDRSDVFRASVPVVTHEEVKAFFAGCVEELHGKPFIHEGEFEGEYTGKVQYLEVTLTPCETTWRVLWEFLCLINKRMQEINIRKIKTLDNLIEPSENVF